MIENRIKPTTANFFWEGPISNYEVASINSFVRHNFKVNIWTYSKSSEWDFISGVEIKDANQILPISLLTQLNQNLQKSNFFLLFQIYLDIDCLKNTAVGGLILIAYVLRMLMNLCILTSRTRIRSWT